MWFTLKSGVVAHACSSSTWETEEPEIPSYVPDLLQLQLETPVLTLAQLNHPNYP